MSSELYTIGHSNLSTEQFIALLAQHKIEAVADVRSHPYSRYLPHFNYQNLPKKLQSKGIKYVFLGKELGARPNNLNCYIQGKISYAKIQQTPEFKQGIKRVIQGMNKYRIALMCAEKDPLDCHRSILICQHLRQENIEIKHILQDGSIESHLELEERLMEINNLQYNWGQLSLFEESQAGDRNQRLKEAYQQQGEKIAYQKP